MRIILDLQGAQARSQQEATSRYSLALAKAMVSSSRGHEFLIALNGCFRETIEPIRAAFDGMLCQDDIKVWQMAGPTASANDDNLARKRIAEKLRRTFFESLTPDVVLVTDVLAGFTDNSAASITRSESFATIATMYDVFPLTHSYPVWENSMRRAEFDRECLRSLQYADQIWTFSEATRKDTLELLGCSTRKCVNISAAVEPCFTTGAHGRFAPEWLKKKFGLTRPFVLSAGGSTGRENHVRLVESFATLAPALRSRYQLFIADCISGRKQGKLAEVARRAGLLRGDLILAENVAEAELVELYRSCALFVFPAWQEGFARAALEAMACGAPVIGAATSSTPEVIADTDALFDPYDVSSIGSKISEVLSNQSRLDVLSAAGAVRASEFSWERCANRALVAMEEWLTSDEHGHSSGATVARPTRSPSDWIDAILDAVANEDALSAFDLQQIARAIAWNHSNRKQRFFVDVSELVVKDSRSGIQRVVGNILVALLKDPPEGFDVFPVYSAPHEQQYRYATKFLMRLQGRPESATSDDCVDWSPHDVFLGLDLQPEVVRAHAETYAELRRLGTKVYFVVYDILPISMPHAFPENVSALHESWLRVVAQSDGLVAISKTVAHEVKAWLSSPESDVQRLRPLNLGSFRLGSDHIALVKPKTSVEHDVPYLSEIRCRKSFLMVGTLEPRKGHQQTLMAFDRLWKSGVDINLVIVGRLGWESEYLVELLSTHPESSRRLFWFDGIGDDQLQLVFRSCSCLIVASEGEGFGLPLVEAAKLGLPAIARDLPVFREIAGSFPTYFRDSLDPGVIADAIVNWLESEPRTKLLSEDSPMPISWQESAKELVTLLLTGTWQLSWSQHDAYSYYAAHQRFRTLVGNRVGRSVVTSGRSGCLLFGPYIRLPAGAYQVRAHGQCRMVSGAWMEAVFESASGYLGRTQLVQSGIEGNSVIASLDFMTHNPVSDFELRIFVDEQSAIVVNSIAIVPLGAC